MNTLQDICSREDIILLVNYFYEQVENDKLFGPVFNAQIGGRWPTHLVKNVRFLAHYFIRGIFIFG